MGERIPRAKRRARAVADDQPVTCCIFGCTEPAINTVRKETPLGTALFHRCATHTSRYDLVVIGPGVTPNG